ncbi:MAG: DUF1080 domain-containing protein [Planctomycetaceae bacterium]|jgi:hypothetical protein|nr:DUF1080 domain-containing protein [Planctomycetaceae bacterium]
MQILQLFSATFILLIIAVLPFSLFGAETNSGVKPPVLVGFDPLTETELQEGWIRLFDGVSLYGWRSIEGKYTVQNGVLVSDPNQNNVIRFTSRFSNSILTGERRPVNSQGNWSPFTLSMKTSQSDRAGIPDITLDSGEFRNIKIQFQGMKPIFDGKTLDGWILRTQANAKVNTKIEAKVDNGVIRLTGGSGSIETKEQYGDFILQLEYKTDKPVNSGVFFRCVPEELMNGYECQIFNNPPASDYKKFIGTDTGGIFRRQVGRNVAPKDGQWNYLTIFARGAQISTWVNGIQTADWVDDRDPDPNPRKGRRTEPGTIQFQGHDAGTDIMFRNIRIGIL